MSKETSLMMLQWSWVTLGFLAPGVFLGAAPTSVRPKESRCLTRS
jgi:hypothetical protein